MRSRRTSTASPTRRPSSTRGGRWPPTPTPGWPPGSSRRRRSGRHRRRSYAGGARVSGRRPGTWLRLGAAPPEARLVVGDRAPLPVRRAVFVAPAASPDGSVVVTCTGAPRSSRLDGVAGRLRTVMSHRSSPYPGGAVKLASLETLVLRRRLAALALRQGDDRRRARRLVGGDRLARVADGPRRRRRGISRRSSSGATRSRSRRSTGISTGGRARAPARSCRRRSAGSRTRSSTSRGRRSASRSPSSSAARRARRSRSTGRTAARPARGPGR